MGGHPRDGSRDGKFADVNLQGHEFCIKIPKSIPK